MTRLSFEKLTELRLLLEVEGIGPGKFRNLLARFKSTDRILSAEYKSLIEVEGISNNLAQRIRRINSQRIEIEKLILKEQEKLDKLKASIVTVWDQEYPDVLKKIYDPPLLLYTIGKPDEKDVYSISVVGTRQPTNYGKIQTERITTDLVHQGITIVSGLARGIDSIAHSCVLKEKGRTIAVIGSGLDVIYPPENKKLFQEIAEKGLIISEYPIGTKPDAQNFPKRNRIISGLSLGTIVIESGVSGGATQTASFALDQGKEIFAVPGNLGIRQSEGTNLLIQKGEAGLIRCAEDVLQSLELKLKPVLGKNIPKKVEGLTLFEEKIITLLTSEPLQIDKIASLTQMNTSECLVHLLSLEFKGMVKQLPGKMFAAL
ncbi:MAG TPA: DNA-processing protein DprA [Ignavibacteriaceae bacterium]|nr:DNA-processing protein DprA [Ignavibacteriaceae bacterium]